jgi:cell fate regulator YaaT (PSP1 superfamily)
LSNGTAMSTFDSDEILDRFRAAANDDGGVCAELEALQTKVSELDASNHRLRVENLTLRTRIEALKSNRSFERKLFGFIGLAIWICFVFVVFSKIFHVLNY